MLQIKIKAWISMMLIEGVVVWTSNDCKILPRHVDMYFLYELVENIILTKSYNYV